MLWGVSDACEVHGTVGAAPGELGFRFYIFRSPLGNSMKCLAMHTLELKSTEIMPGFISYGRGLRWSIEIRDLEFPRLNPIGWQGRAERCSGLIYVHERRKCICIGWVWNTTCERRCSEKMTEAWGHSGLALVSGDAGSPSPDLMTSTAVMNGIRSLCTSLVCSLTDIFPLISVLLGFSLDLYDTSYPCLPPCISLTRLTSLRHLLPRRFSKVKAEVASTCHLLTAQYSVLTTHKSAVNHTAVQPSRHPDIQPTG
jgi:hypothetical protein